MYTSRRVSQPHARTYCSRYVGDKSLVNSSIRAISDIYKDLIVTTKVLLRKELGHWDNVSMLHNVDNISALRMNALVCETELKGIEHY